MSALIVPASMLLYLVLPIWMLTRGWPIRAGLAMIVTALLPWAVWLPEVEEPSGAGAGMALILTALMLLLALVPIGIGGGLAVSRHLGRRREPTG